MYQKNKFKDWNDKIREKAMGFLKYNILTKVGECKYEVNFS